MFHLFKKRRNAPGFTLVEIIVGASLITIIAGMVAHWFFMQRRYQQQVMAISDAQQNVRQASWNMTQELRTARTIILPRMNADKSIKSDSKVIFKNFAGDIVCFYHVPEKAEIRRCMIPNGPGSPVTEAKPVGKGIEKAVFTAHDIGNHLIGIYLETPGAFGLESIYLINE